MYISTYEKLFFLEAIFPSWCAYQHFFSTAAAPAIIKFSLHTAFKWRLLKTLVMAHTDIIMLEIAVRVIGFFICWKFLSLNTNSGNMTFNI